MTFETVFQTVKEIFMKADVSKVDEHLAFQFNITGEGEGIFYAEAKEGRLYVEPYEYYDRDAIFICSADTLLKLEENWTLFLHSPQESLKWREAWKRR